MKLQKLGLVLAVGLATNLAFAHDGHGGNTVWTDAEGAAILSANGECVRAIDFDELGKKSCHDKAEVKVVEVIEKVEPAAAPAPAPAPAEPVYMFQRKEHQVLFDTDSAMLTAAGKAQLDKVIEFANNAYHLSALQIKGNTDSRGSEAYNMDLSSQRIDAVKAYLEAQDVRATATMAMGEKNLVMVNGQEDMTASRRADVMVRAKVIKQQ